MEVFMGRRWYNIIAERKEEYFPLKMFIFQCQVYCRFISVQFQCELWNRLHRGLHRHQNRIHSFCSARFSCQGSKLGTVKEAHHLGGFFLYKTGQQKTIVNCLIGLQQRSLVCQTHLALLHLFPRSVRSWFHNSYTAVQSLLTVLTLLCVKPSYQCVSKDRSPEFSQTFNDNGLWCKYLFVAIKGVYF